MMCRLKLTPQVAMLLAGLVFLVTAETRALAAAGPESTPVAKLAPVAKNCIDLGWLDRSQIVDDQTILFHMKGGQVYENKLPYRCFGLKFEDGFAFATSLHQLCNTDIIKVLHRGTSCGLGMFIPLDKAKTGNDAGKTKAGAKEEGEKK
jgi:hypothetical protein